MAVDALLYLNLACYGLTLLPFVAYIIMLFGHTISLIFAKVKFHAPLHPPLEDWPGVSILKPLHGTDPNQATNLETVFKLDYPKYEVLMCVQDIDDPVLEIVHACMNKYPKVDAKLFVGGQVVGINPKVNNMMPGYTAAKYGLIMISDAAIKVHRDTLKAMAGAFSNDKVGIVHQMPYATHRPGFAGTLEQVYFGGSHAKVYLAAQMLGINCVTGMSFIFRKYVIDELGGLASFGKWVAEDFYISKAFVQKGMKFHLSSLPAYQNAGVYSVRTFQARMVRWTQLRMSMLPHFLLMEPLSECVTLGAMNSWAVWYHLSWNPIAFFLFHLLLWMLIDYWRLNLVEGGPLPFRRFDFTVAWVVREFMFLRIYFGAIANPNIQWRTRKLRLHWGGTADIIAPKIKA